MPKFDPETVSKTLNQLGRGEDGWVISTPTISFEQLYAKISPLGRKLVEQVIELEPVELGIATPFVSLAEPPADLVAISGQKYRLGDKEKLIAPQYLPATTRQAFDAMAKELAKDLGRQLMVESGYRSPAYQAVVWLGWLEFHKFDVAQVARGVALPGYSQHGDPRHTALDVVNQDGSPTDEAPEKFAETAEYQWLIKNAGRFGFELSYPSADNNGIKFEPWHWRYTA